MRYERQDDVNRSGCVLFEFDDDLSEPWLKWRGAWRVGGWLGVVGICVGGSCGVGREGGGQRVEICTGSLSITFGFPDAWL